MASSYVTLLGAEQIERAGYAIRGAADDMTRAAGSICESIATMNSLVDRFEQAAEKIDAAVERLILDYPGGG